MKKSSSQLTVNLLQTSFRHPLFLPSGIITEIPDHHRAQAAGAAMVVLKSLTLQKREGNPLPRVVKYGAGFINSVGLRNPGLEEGGEQINQFLQTAKIPVIISVFATKIDEFKRLVSSLAELKPTAIELNLSCPNVENELGVSLGMNASAAEQTVAGVKKVVKNVPIVCKLSPNVVDIAEIGRACEAAGADALSAINTVAPGMIIDLRRRRPALGNKQGGLSGPAIKPIALAHVYALYKAVRIPILGMGGVSTVEDALEMLMAGATLVGVGSAVYVKGDAVFKEILKGIMDFLWEQKIASVTDLIGAAH